MYLRAEDGLGVGSMYLRAEDGLGAGETEVLDVLGGAEDRLLSREKYLKFRGKKC